MEQQLVGEIKRLVADLVAGRYADIAADGRGGRLTRTEIQTAISRYGRTLIAIPDEGMLLVDVCEAKNDPNTFLLDVPLWTLEEGRSDLTLSLTAEKHGGQYEVRIDDLHVL